MPNSTIQIVINTHVSGFLSQLAAEIECWLDRIHERRALSRLTERQLRDIGVSSATADAEIEKPFWRA